MTQTPDAQTPETEIPETHTPETGAPQARTPEAAFTAHRSLLVGVAYRMLGSVGDAEDVVQEAWLRWSRRGPRRPSRTRAAYLVTDHDAAGPRPAAPGAARRESYVGPWLPEPVSTGGAGPRGDDRRGAADSVSLALLVVLETLSPLERAVFVLREAFAYSYAEIAEILDRSPAAVRQLAHRAREHVEARRPRFEADAASAGRRPSASCTPPCPATSPR